MKPKTISSAQYLFPAEGCISILWHDEVYGIWKPESRGNVIMTEYLDYATCYFYFILFIKRVRVRERFRV